MSENEGRKEYQKGELVRAVNGCGIVKEVYRIPTHEPRGKGHDDGFRALISQPNGQKIVLQGFLAKGELKPDTIITFNGNLYRRDRMKDGKPDIDEQTGKPRQTYYIDAGNKCFLREMKSYESPILKVVWSDKDKKDPTKYAAIVEIDAKFKGGKAASAFIRTDTPPVVGAKLSLQGVIVEEPRFDKETGEPLMKEGTKQQLVNLKIHAFETKMVVPEEVAKTVEEAQPLPAEANGDIPWDDDVDEEESGPTPC